MTDPNRPPTGVDPGEFPFPLAYGVSESRYLTWIRNHSNYMAVRGLIDYVRLVAVLLRGALLNFLITIPWLLAVSLIVAADRVYLDETFDITRFMLSLGLVLLVAWPLGALFLTLLNYRRTRATGSEMTMEMRDRTQTVFAVAMIAIVAAASVDGLAALLDRYHDFVSGNKLTLPQIASVSGVAIAVYSIADRILGRLGGLSRQLALLLVGALGIIIPAIVVLHLAHFVVYDRVYYDSAWMTIGTAGIIGIGLIILFWTGVLARAFSWRDGVVAFAFLLVVVSALAWLGGAADTFEMDHHRAAAEIRQAAFSPESWTRAARAEADSAAAPGDLRAILSDSHSDRSTETLDAQYKRIRREYAEHPGPAIGRLHDWIFQLAPAPATEPRPQEACPEGKAARFTPALCRELQEFADEAASAKLYDAADAARAVGHSTPAPAARPDTLEAHIREILTDLSELTGGLRAQKALVAAQFASRDTFALRALEYAELVSATEYAAKVTEDDGKRPEYLDRPTYGFAPAYAELGKWADKMHEVEDEFATMALYDPTRYPRVFAATAETREKAFGPKAELFFIIGVVIFGFVWIAVDVNQTSVHGLWRDRLASAFLVGADRKGDVDVEEDIDLADLARHEAGSTAPYHLINVALNLHASDDIDLRDRRSDFFIFSKRFTGSRHTGYCRSETMERVFPHMGLGAAMAISAAAASPNMGRATNPALVALMTLLNIRLGVWVPHPGRLQERVDPDPARPKPRRFFWMPRAIRGAFAEPPGEPGTESALGFGFEDVFREELREVGDRWNQLRGDHGRRLATTGGPGATITHPTAAHGLVGLAFSGGGIRSATLNLGIVQMLHARGVFDHVDYMSTVSGGGFIGSSISAIMRAKVPTDSDIAGRVAIRDLDDRHIELEVTPSRPLVPGRGRDVPRKYVFRKDIKLTVAQGDSVFAGQRLVQTRRDVKDVRGSWGEVFSWRVPPRALLRELLSMLHEDWDWVNVSDGGHIENLATMELLRRRCKYIIIGDGEADPTHRFNGLATVIRTARLDLGVEIYINVDPLRLDANGNTKGHWAVGTIEYPPMKPGDPVEHGRILYFKSSVTGKEDEVIREYRRGSPTFPHESTADQAFTEGQFEAYRSLGAYVARDALTHLKASDPSGRCTYADLEQWMNDLPGVQRAESVLTH